MIDGASAREAKARRKKGGGGGGGGESSRNSAENTRDLSDVEILELKQKIISLLQPGENVLAALRRLGRARKPTTATPPSGEAAVTATAPIEEVPMAEDTKGAQESQIQNPGSTLDKTRVGTDQKLQQKQQQQHTTSYNNLIKRASLTPQVQLEFDQLTDWSSLLMEAGEFMIHSKTWEELVNSLQKQQQSVDDGNSNSGAGGGSGGAVEKDECAVKREDIDLFAEEEDTVAEVPVQVVVVQP